MADLANYARVVMPGGERRIAGSTEATRGCKHLCRHCPIVPVYNGAFRVVEREIVLDDIRQQVAAGARHITFGDPDFFNGPAHSLSIVEAMHSEFPDLSYDVTIKIEHLRKHDALLPTLRDTGCLFVISAVESVDDRVLEKFDKGHTRADFLAVAARFRELGMTLLPTFVPFTPWTTLEGYIDLLSVIAREDLRENVAPIQLAIRLLIPAGSRLLDLPEVRGMVGPFDSAALVFPWKHEDRARRCVVQLDFRPGAARRFAETLAHGNFLAHLARRARRRGNHGAPGIPVDSAASPPPFHFSTNHGIAAPSPWTISSSPSGKPSTAPAKADQFV